MGWPEILAELETGRSQIDEHSSAFQALAADHRSRIYCEKGCCNCCTLTVDCSFPEALAISRALSQQQHQLVTEKIPQLTELSRQAGNLKEFMRRFREQLGGCPFLAHENGCCTTYHLRPFSCRALLSTRNSSWCAVDFASLHPLEKEAFLSSLDQELVAFPTHYLASSQKQGLALETRAVSAMGEAFSIAMSGNLIYQVWLEQQFRLSAVIEEGAAAVVALLREQQLALPFLLRVEQHGP